MIDALFVNSIGPGFTLSSTRAGIGGSELEIVLVAHALARRGHKVVVANGVDRETVEDGVRYVPFASTPGMKTRALWIERGTIPLPGIDANRMIVRATDINCAHYDGHRQVMRDGRVAVVVNTQWQSDGFAEARERIIIPPALDYDLGGKPVKRVRGRFVYVSAPMKGLQATLDTWRRIIGAAPKLIGKAKLIVTVPKFSDFYGDKPPQLSTQDEKLGITIIESPGLIEYRRLIASAEGLFFVNTMPETFGCVAAFAERFGTRPHILCAAGKAGLSEALTDTYRPFLTEDGAEFEKTFLQSVGRAPIKSTPIDRSPDALAPAWESAMHLTTAPAGSVTTASGPTTILTEMQDRLVALADAPITNLVTDYWRGTATKLAEMAKTQPLDKFLMWTTDVDQEELLPVFHSIHDALRTHPQWASRWHRLSRKAPGVIVHPFSRDAGASPITIQHAYHLMRYEDAAGHRFVDDLDAVVEFGGAHGNFVRLLREDGFRGPHFVIDLPHVLEFARAYLRLCDVPVGDDLSATTGAVLLTDKGIDAMLTMLRGKRVGFVATYSLSEAPLALRDKLFPAMHGMTTKYIITSQWPVHTTDPDIDNEAYFTRFMRESGAAFRVEPHPEMTKMRYILGSPGKAGTHVAFYPNTLPPEQPNHVHGGIARRYWVHNRVLSGGSILDTADSDTLKKLGVTHVLSAEHERDDAGKWPDDKRARYEFPDDGQAVSLELLHKAMDFAERALATTDTVLYTHCRLGGSRGPSMGYLTLRTACNYDPARAMAAVLATREKGWTPHFEYIKSIERAITSRGGKPVDEALAYQRIVSAYRNTPTPVRAAQSNEQLMAQEDLSENLQPLGPQFGSYLSALRKGLCVGGSEYGLGLMLMALTASVRAANIAEIGRFRGFSTLALASGLALADAGWKEPLRARQRPDVNYDQLLSSRKRRLVSIDPHPTPEADTALAEAGLSHYVQKLDVGSDNVDLTKHEPFDLVLIDGSHEEGQVRRDIAKFVPWVRAGGYFVLHDYYGWYTPDGHNGSPIKKAIDADLKDFEQIQIDTGFASFVVFRKNIEMPPAVKRAPARADGRPTVGLVLIAKGDEGATIIARALVSAWKMVDAVTVVTDGGPQTAEVCRHMGADVYVRPTPKVDWDRGTGYIAAARNMALTIAEPKTDYVLILDPDDTFEGEIPNRLDADAYEVIIYDGPMRYARIQLFKSGKGFHYEGIRHEALAFNGRVERIPSLRYIRGHGGHQDQDAPKVKYAKHAKDLEKWLIDHPNDTRAQFYLAQSYRDGQEPAKAVAAYERRIVMGEGYPEERAYAALQIARIVRERGDDPTSAFLRAYEMSPSRAEALTELANWLRDEKQKRYALAVTVARRASEIPLPAEAFFVNANVYRWGALEEYAIASYWAGDKVTARECYRQLLDRVPDGLKPFMQNMLAMCIRETGG